MEQLRKLAEGGYARKREEQNKGIIYGYCCCTVIHAGSNVIGYLSPFRTKSKCISNRLPAGCITSGVFEKDYVPTKRLNFPCTWSPLPALPILLCTLPPFFFFFFFFLFFFLVLTIFINIQKEQGDWLVFGRDNPRNCATLSCALYES